MDVQGIRILGVITELAGFFVQEQLDRFLCSRSWKNLRLFSIVSDLFSWCSDYCSIMLSCKTSMMNMQQPSCKPCFHCKVYWKYYAQCRDIIVDR